MNKFNLVDLAKQYLGDIDMTTSNGVTHIKCQSASDENIAKFISEAEHLVANLEITRR